jgi:hypothetical protein
MEFTGGCVCGGTRLPTQPPHRASASREATARQASFGFAEDRLYQKLVVVAMCR